MLPSRVPDERYEVHGTLGRGGVAVVYAATDLATGRKLAMKRLRAQDDPVTAQRITELFEREFQTLAQLAHPNIVQVYDYGIDQGGPFYTMELAEGGDLQQLAPLPWRRACSIARGLCSALSLLHSRRLVHRDLSPRNVRCGPELQPKLIDFGALAPFGANKYLVGTPTCCAPESVHLQPLDGRTDLYSLGATLYQLLCGRPVYMARSFEALADCWQMGFARPCELQPDVPESLEGLLLDLLRLEPDARPASAAEVMQRLSAIDGESLTEQHRVARAYLATPVLVGRDEQLARVRRKLERTLRRGRGHSVVVTGPAGVGRSRVLDMCVLQATLLGASAVRADADDAASGDYGVVRAIARQLMTTMPQIALEAARPGLHLLARLVPEAFGPDCLPPTAAGGLSLSPLRSIAPRLSLAPPLSGPAQAAADSLAMRPQLQAALQAWITALCRERPLLIAVDDFTRIDEPSAALLALLAHDAVDGLCSIATAESEAPSRAPAAQRVLFEASSQVELGNLGRADSEQLLKSLFGEVPNLSELAHRLHALAGGNPRDLLSLAQHLVDRSVASYEAGAWTLPAQIDPSDLPRDMAQALRERVEALHEAPRRLAAACALCPDQTFTLDECEILSEHKGAGLMLDLDEAVSAQILRGVEDGYALSSAVWIGPLRSSATPELERNLHTMLAQVFERRGLEFRAGQHWLSAGESSRALDVLVAHARTSQHQTAKSSEAFYRYAGTLPRDWFEIYERALALCSALDRPARDAFTLRSRLSGIVPAFSVHDRGNAAILLAQLARDSGLEDFQTLPDSLGPTERIQRAIAIAEERYAAMPERARVLSPSEAIASLTRVMMASLSRVTVGLDVPYLRSLPDLAPFAPISPALAVVARLLEGMGERYAGRFERACEIYREVLERTGQPDRAGLDASYCEYTRLGVMNGLDMMESCLGRSTRREWGLRTAAHPAFQVNAVATRGLYHLFQGDVRAADQCRRQVERLRIETRQMYDGASLTWEIVAHVIAEDLTRVREAFAQIAVLAERYVPWRAVEHYASAAYHRIRRDPARALPEIEAALAIARAGEHVLWSQIAATHIAVLCDLGRHAEALAIADRCVTEAQRAGLGYLAEPVWLSLAVCQAHVGRASAAATADASIARLHAREVRGLNLGAAHEARARVALLLRDSSSFEQHAELCYEAYGCYRNPALLAKYRRLRQLAERRERLEASATARERVVTRTGIEISAAFAGCKNPPERARTALSLLLAEAEVSAGLLFTLGVDQAECVATAGEASASPGLLSRVTEYLLSQTQDAPTTSSDVRSSAPREWRDEEGRRLQPVLLCHETTGSWVITGAAVLIVRDGAETVSTALVASVISRAWADAGSTPLMFAGEA